MIREYIAYKGQAFQIEWYYSQVGKSQALEYYQELEMADRVKVLNFSG